jgi:hypothetical protein
MGADSSGSAGFIVRLRGLDAKGSRHELSIEKFSTKRQEAPLDDLKKGERGKFGVST